MLSDNQIYVDPDLCCHMVSPVWSFNRKVDFLKIKYWYLLHEDEIWESFDSKKSNLRSIPAFTKLYAIWCHNISKKFHLPDFQFFFSKLINMIKKKTLHKSTCQTGSFTCYGLPGSGICWALPLTMSWHHYMETLSALLAFCVGNPPMTGGFPSQRDL